MLGNSSDHCLHVMQPLIVMANKCDVRKISELSEENQVSEIVFYILLLLVIYARNLKPF